MSLPIVFGQGTPATPAPTPTPNLQFQPQKAFIITQNPDGEFQAVPLQQQSSAIGTGETAGIIGILTGVATGIWAKMSGSKDNKQTNAAVLQGMTVDSELAKYVNKVADPVKVEAAEGTAPLVKLETLEKNKAEFTETAVKK